MMRKTRNRKNWSSDSDSDVILELSTASTSQDSDDFEGPDGLSESEIENGTVLDLESENFSENDTENDYDLEDGYDNDYDSDSTSYSDSDYENGFYSDSVIDSDSDSYDTDSSYDFEMLVDSDNEMISDSNEEMLPLQQNANIFDPSLHQHNIFSHDVSEPEAREFLNTWVMDSNVNHCAVNPLLRFLKKVWPKLCVDARTLMKTPKEREVIDIPPGTYVHLGIKRSLDLLLSTIDIECIPDQVLLTFNIDGVPLSKSSPTGFWLILARVENVLRLRKFIFVIGVYYGRKKPRSFNDFLRPFVMELVYLQEVYQHRDKNIYIKVNAFICDAPAKADVKYIKHPTGFFGCDKCEQKGQKINHRMTFRLNNECLRSNGSFRSRANDAHHKDDPIIESIEDLDMVNDFPLDPLHVIYLGVMKRLLRLWLNKDSDTIMNPATINAISSMLISIGKSQPKEFQRKCRDLSEIGYYKGHEFRTFLLYSGPVVLKNQLPIENYNHFLLLHTAITILSNKEMCQKFNLLAKMFLQDFVNGMAEHYGVWNVVLCVHSLIHIPDDVKKYGDLNQYSAFDFESYMFQIKRQIKKHNTHQAELCNRIEEKNSANFVKTSDTLSFPMFKKPKSLHRRKIFREVRFKDFTLKKSDGNNWFMTNKSEIVRFEHVEKINDIWYVYGYERKIKANFYTIPIQSSKLNIYRSFIREECGKLYLMNEITKKMFCMNLDTNYDFFVPLNHCN